MNHALIIGQNFVLPECYGGWEGVLACCENDANGHAQLALRGGCKVRQLVTNATQEKGWVTKDEWRKAMEELATVLQPGELLYYAQSGHGSSDAFGQGIVFADGIVFEDEFRARLANFREGVKVFCFLDLCHSGGISIPGARAFAAGVPKPKGMPVPMFSADTRDSVGQAYQVGEPLGIKASVAILAAALTEEVAYDGDTAADFGRATGGWLASFRGFDNAVRAFACAKTIVHGQTLNLRIIGGGNPGWLSQPLFI